MTEERMEEIDNMMKENEYKLLHFPSSYDERLAKIKESRINDVNPSTETIQQKEHSSFSDKDILFGGCLVACILCSVIVFVWKRRRKKNLREVQNFKGVCTTRVCQKCGADIPDGMRFCGQCGMKIEETTTNSAREVQEQLSAEEESDIRETPVRLEEDIVARHEEATQAPLFSFLGLLSTEGRRGRLKTLKTLVIQMITFGLFFGFFSLFSRHFALIIFHLAAFWIGTTTVFKRLHDLDKPNFVGIIFTIVGIIYCFVDAIVQFDPRILLTNSPIVRVYGVLSLVMVVFSLYLLITPGTKWSNRYGRSFDELKELQAQEQRN